MSAAAPMPDLLTALQQVNMDPPDAMQEETVADRRMSEDQIRTAVETEISAARQVTEGDLAQNRRFARDYYNRRPLGLLTPQEGKSQVVLSDVRDSVGWAMPGFMRTFFGGLNFGRVETTR